MFYYKFRVYFDEVEDFVRDIEILSTDNFESFYRILYLSLGLSGNELASFSICDSKWNKKNEITLIDMCDDQNAEVPEYDENDDFSTRSNLPKFIMKDSILKDFIKDPHQNIIFEFDFLNPMVFYIELMKTLEVKDSVTYPRCTKSVKELPKKVEKLNINPEDDNINPDDEANLESPFDFDDDFSDEDLSDFSTDGFDDSTF